MSVERKTSGSYLARWRDPAGKQRARTFKRKRDADDFLATVTVDKLSGRYVDPSAGKITVSTYVKQWASGQPWRPSTRDRYEFVIERQILPRFGSMPLRAVRASDVQAWVGEMTASGLAPSTVASYYAVLASVMRTARQRDELIVKSPCERVTMPRDERNSAALVPLTAEQVHGLADAVPDRYQALVLTSAGLGLRQGEACGLTLDRVDFLRRTVRIDRQLVTPPGKGPVRFGPVKTTASDRVLPLPDSVGEVLAAHLQVFEPGAEVGGEHYSLIFTSRTGAPLRRSTWGTAFKRAARDVEVDASSHDLRHHCASMLISAGCSVKAVQSFLGHKNASETLDTYGHLWPGDDDRMRAAIDAGLRKDVHGMCMDADTGSA